MVSRGETYQCGPFALVGSPDEVEELPDGSLILLAECRYLVRLGPGADVAHLGSAFQPLPGGAEALLRFGNFVGESSLGGRRLEVRSDRISADDVEEMLSELVRAAPILPLHHTSPSWTGAARDLITGPDVPYLAWLHVRDAVGGGHHDLPTALARILARPHRRLVREAADVPLERCDELNARTLMAVAARPERLVFLGPGHSLGATPIARALGGRLPYRVYAETASETTDTPENRFVVLGLETAMQVVRRFHTAMLRTRPARWEKSVEEAHTVSVALARWRDHPVLERTPAALAPLPQSTVLRARPGYREFAAFMQDLQSRTRWAPEEDARQMVGARDAAAIYEYWCLAQVLRSLERVTGDRAEPLPIATDEFGARVRHATVRVGPVDVHFNRTYSKPRGDSYSVPLRPDISVSTPQSEVHLLDAKLRVDAPFPASTSSEVPDEVDAQEAVGTFKRGDLYKMHAYRDATGAGSAWILYPGSGSSRDWFEALDARADGGPRGVGALPLRPGNATSRDLLDTLMAWMLIRVPAIPHDSS